MSFKSFVKSEFDSLQIQDILRAAPSVLLGVSAAMEPILETMRIRTVFDLALSPLFGSAARVLAESGDVGSTYRKFGRAPASVIDGSLLAVEAVTSLPRDDLRTLVGIGPDLETLLTAGLAIQTVRDLALWPPYLAAKAIVVQAYNPSLPGGHDPEAPRELIPSSGEFGTERHLYSAVVMFPGTYASSVPLQNTLFDLAETALTGFDRMRFGARLTYSQTWFPKYVAKGQLLHSLPLAPGESTSVAVIDWANKSKAATEQTISESERLASTNDRTRAVSQIARSVARDFEIGASVEFAQSASASSGGGGLLGNIGFGTASSSVNEATSSTHTVSTGSRSVATSLRQNIVDSTQQNSSSVRSQRAAVVSEVSQSDRKNFSTRNVTNYNHMHALTLQYYEVVQIYETQVRLEDQERCIFIPMKLFDFHDERVVVKYLPILRRVALNYTTMSQLRQIEDNAYAMTLQWGTVRVPWTPEGKQWVSESAQSHRVLDQHGFIKVVDDAGKTLNDLELHSHLQLNNVVVFPSRTRQPRSMVASVLIDLEDGSTLAVQTPPQALPGDPAVIHAAFNGKPLSFRQISAMRLVGANYTATDAPSHHVKVFLAVTLNGESRFLDASFAMIDTSGSNLSGATLFSTDGPRIPRSLQDDLMDHQLYYSQQIWLRMNPQSLVMKFAPLRLTIGGEAINLVDYISPIPVKVVGNYVVYRFTYEKDNAWRNWLQQNSDPARVDADSVAIPTGGVFCEAVLGRFNAAERLDLTRFANWHDSPPAKPPEIAAVRFAEPSPPGVPPQATFAPPLVSIQNPITLPAPSGLSEVLASIVRGASFPDVSGLTQSGDAAAKATDLASTGSVAALKASGEAFAQLITSISNVLKTAVSKDATKTLSDVGALLNTKEEKDKAGGAVGKQAGSAPGGAADGSLQAPDAETRALDSAIAGSVLASLASGLVSGTATDATTYTDATAGTGSAAIPVDQALLQSMLITDPLFPDVTGFLVLLQLMPDEILLNVVRERFGNLDNSLDVRAKYTEVLAKFMAISQQLTGADRILFALRFQKMSVLPDDSTLDQNEIRKVKDLATEAMVNRAYAIAKRVFPGGAKAVMREIFLIANAEGAYNINHVAYMLATAYHESNMGKYMTELHNGVSTDTVFTKDEYFFEKIPGVKNSYNGINGNVLAGDQLMADGYIASTADRNKWNGTTYPGDQPDAVKRAARACDFYRFIGRGLVQVTGRSNYQRYSNLPAYGNEDFLANPEKVSEVTVAARILVTGMLAGDFRGHKLSDYDKTDGVTDWFDGVNARDIVNGDMATNGPRVRDLAVEFKNSLIINSSLDESVEIQ